MSHQKFTNISIIYADGSCANKRNNKSGQCQEVLDLADLMYSFIFITQPLLHMFLVIMLRKNSYQDPTQVSPLSCGPKNVDTVQYFLLYMSAFLHMFFIKTYISLCPNPIHSTHYISTKKAIHVKDSQVFNYFLNVNLLSFPIFIPWPDISPFLNTMLATRLCL